MNMRPIKNVLCQLFSKNKFIWRSVIYNFASLIFLLGLASTSFSAGPPYCSDIFSNGLIAYGDGSKIEFERNAQLLGRSHYLLKASSVISDYYSPKMSCDNFFCRTMRTEAPAPVVIPQKVTFSTNDVIVHANKKKTIGKKIAAYGRIDVERGATLSFMPRTISYTIDELNLEHKSKLQLPAGEYWVGNLSLDEAGKIEVIGEGTAILYVINDASIPAKFKINDNTQDPAKLVIYAFGKLNFATSSKTHAFINSLGDTRLERKANIVGAVIAKNIYLAAGSKVTFAQESLQNLHFGNACLGAPPSKDFTAPLIELDPFPYNSLTSSITISGKITEPDNDARWLDRATLNYWGSSTEIALDSDGRFTVELPLTSTINYFTISAQDKSYNTFSVNFTVLRETNIELSIKMDAFEWQQITPMPVSGVITIPEGKVIESAFIKTAQGDIPLLLVNNRFSLYLPFVRGYNEYLVVAQDQDGNEVSEMIYIEGLSNAVLEQVRLVGTRDRPERSVTGFVYSLWPLEDLSLTIDEIPQELTQVGEGIYEFSADTILSVGRNRIHITVTTPEGNTYGEFDDWYEPDRIFLSIEETSTETPDDQPQTIKITGTLHIPLELIRKSMSVVVISDRFPGVEYPVNTPGLNEVGYSSFSIDIPLVTGVNNLLVKVKQRNQDANAEIGVDRIEIRAIGI